MLMADEVPGETSLGTPKGLQRPYDGYQRPWISTVISDVERLTGGRIHMRYNEAAYEEFVDPISSRVHEAGIYAWTEAWYPQEDCDGTTIYAYVLSSKYKVAEIPEDW
jgi:hypothetical protein